MRIVCISDTHGYHRSLALPDGDTLVHTGDLTGQSNITEVRDFLAWFSEQPHGNKVFIAGNHDRLFEKEPEMVASLIPTEITYLKDSGCVIAGLNFWGSPVQPRFYDWAFNRDRGADIAKHWYMIPEHTDVVMTHGPARGILDTNSSGQAVGCADLRRRLEIVQPRLHVCGHIHGGYGTEFFGRTHMVNAAICDEDYRPVRTPLVIDL